MDETEGVLLLSRTRGAYRDALRRYAVLIDDVPVGSVKRGETVRFELPAGEYRLQLKIDWCTSPVLVAVVEPGRTVCFLCAPGGDASEAWADATVGRRGYITLGRVTEPHVLTGPGLDRRTRIQLGLGLGFFAGCFAIIGGGIAGASGAEPGPAGAFVAAGMAVALVSSVGFRLSRRRR